MTAALTQGGREFFGWGVDRYLMADIYDALNVNTKATGQWKKGKAPDFPLWPRPKGTKSERKPKRVTLADLHRQLSTGGGVANAR